jgi:hypothetical protein
LSIPLLRFNPPLRFTPETSVLNLSAQDNSHGIFFPYSAYRQKESTSSPFDRRSQLARSENCSSTVDGSHSINYGVAHELSQLPSDLLLSLPPCHFQTGGTHGVRPTGIYSSCEASGDSSPPEYPLAVSPSGCATTGPRPGFLRAHSPPPRIVRSYAFPDFRVFVLARISQTSRSQLVMSCLAQLAPLGLSPPHGINPHRRAELTSHYRHA